MRLDRFIHDLGHGSRKEIRRLIRSGRVAVADVVVHDPSFAVASHHIVAIDGEAQRAAQRMSLIMHKPAGVLTAMKDRRRPTVADHLPESAIRQGVAPVGRLDLDTTGLLLFSNDGQLIHRLQSPRHAIEKTYEVEYSGVLPHDAVAQVKAGLLLSDGLTRPAQLEVHDEMKASLTITEGRHHQVKRMFHALGCSVERLHRSRIGPLSLPADLPPGACRPLHEEELQLLIEATALL